MEYSSQLQVTLQDFKQLQKDGSLPSKMRFKLQYLESAILGLKKQHQLINELPEMEQLSLQQMSRQHQIMLFISIVKCLTGKEIIEYFSNQKSTIKKEQAFSGWNECYISCNSNIITAIKKLDSKQVWYEFYIDKLYVSKVYRQHKKRYVFGIAYNKSKYQVGFDEEGTCARIHGIILNLIRERRSLRERLKGANNSQINGKQVASELQFERQQESDVIFGNQYNQQDAMNNEQKEYLSQLQNNIKKIQLFDNTNFQLVKNIESGRILENKNNSSFKICLLIEKNSIENILENFVDLHQWNAQVQTFKIINRIRSNTFLAYLKLKKYSLMTYPRETYLTITFFKTCSCLTQQKKQNIASNDFGKYYIIMNTVQHEKDSQFSRNVKIKFSQIVQFSPMQDSKTIFMVIQSKIDFNCYEYFNNNREMNMLYLNEFSYFPNYCRQFHQSQKLLAFDFDYCACKIKKKRKNSYQSDLSSISNKQDQIIKAPPSSEIKAKKKINVLDIIERCHQGYFDDGIIQVIKQNLFSSYYLRHKFSEAISNPQYKASNYTYRQEKDFLLQNGKWKISNGNLVFINQEILKAQKGVIKMILKQIGSNLMSGKSIMNMSLPVQIFDNKSMLEVLANMMGFFPRFINDAINAKDLVEQIKYVTMSYIFLNSCFPNVQKPFNPILGETFQGLIGGIPIYLQQTFHHPPISTLYIKTDEFETYGNFDIHVDIGLNSANSKISSLMTVKIFKTKTQYVIKLGDIQMGGVSFGQRILTEVGKGFVYEKTNNLYCEFSVGKDKKKVYEYGNKLKNTDLAGGIFKVTPAFGKRLLTMDRSKPFQGVKFDQIIQKYCHISGRWFGDIFFDNVAYKTLQNGPFPVKLQRPIYLLPSDSLFRTDLIYKSKNELQKANQQKQILQNKQRRDKKMREKYKTK